MMAKGTRDEGYFWASKHREKEMKRVLGKMKKGIIIGKQKKLVEY